MQTFLPFPDFRRSMSSLDPLRLGNQVYRECKTLISGGWPHHPVAKMWTGYRMALAKYAIAGLEELTARGRHYPHHYEFFNAVIDEEIDTGMPWWLGWEPLHLSHRSNLIRKRPEWYGPMFPGVAADLPYAYPSMTSIIARTDDGEKEGVHDRLGKTEEAAETEMRRVSQRIQTGGPVSASVSGLSQKGKRRPESALLQVRT